MRCPNCDHENPGEYSFCEACGTKLEKTLICPACELENPSGSKFCSNCGTLLGTKICPTCNRVNEARNKFCEKCGTPFGTQRTGARVPASAGAAPQGIGGQQYVQATQERVNPFKLLVSLGMRFIVSALVGIGISQFVSWLGPMFIGP